MVASPDGDPDLLAGMRDALAAAMGTAVHTAEHPMLTGALGAALIAAERGAS